MRSLSNILLPPLIVLCLGAGCATAPTARADDEDGLEATARAMETVSDAIANSAQRQSAEMFSSDHAVVVRFNPASCACPPFELYLAGRWQRGVVRWSAESLNPTDALARATAMAQRGEDTGRHPLYIFRLRMVGERVLGPTLLEYPVFRVSETVDLGTVGLARAVEFSLLTPDELRRSVRRGRRSSPGGAPVPALAPVSPAPTDAPVPSRSVPGTADGI